jgi:hypothetical protein
VTTTRTGGGYGFVANENSGAVKVLELNSNTALPTQRHSYDLRNGSANGYVCVL